MKLTMTTNLTITLGLAILVAIAFLWYFSGLEPMKVSGNSQLPAAGAAEDPQEGVDPDLKRLSLMSDDSTVELQVDFYNATTPTAGNPHIYLYGDVPHRYNIWITDTEFMVKQDTDANGHFETDVGSGPTTSSNGGKSWHAFIPRSFFPDLIGMELWAYAPPSQDRVPDANNIIVAEKPVLADAAGAAEDPQEGVDPDLKRLSLMSDESMVELQVDFYNATTPTAGNPHIYLYGDVPHRYNIWITDTEFMVKQDTDANGHFETDVGSGPTTSSNGGKSWHAFIPRSFFPDLIGMELWAYDPSSQDRVPDANNIIVAEKPVLADAAGAAEDPQEGVDPDLKRLSLMSDDSTVELQVDFYNATTPTAGNPHIYLYGDVPHRYNIWITDTEFMVKQDTDANGHFETDVGSGPTTSSNGGKSWHAFIPRSFFPDLIGMELWAYDPSSQDRVPDANNIIVAEKPVLADAAGVAEDPQEGVDPDLKRLSLMSDESTVELQVDFYNATTPTAGNPHIYLYGDVPHRYNIWITDTEFMVKQDTDANGHFETDVGSGPTTSSNGGKSWHASIPRSFFPDLIGMELWAYAPSSQDRVPDQGGDLIIGPPPTCHGLKPTIVGTNGDDVIFGSPGIDVILGLDGDDIISGMAGDDVICARPGEDVVKGGPGRDWIFGGLDDDVILGGKGADRRLAGDDGDDMLRGGGGNDKLLGGRGNDVLVGGLGNDRLVGHGGDDMIAGGDGDDKINCGRGRDFANGGPGTDTARANCTKSVNIE